MSNSISLGDRMKRYEQTSQMILPYRLPLIVRVDGKAFSKYTKKLNKPFDRNFISVMEDVAVELCREIQGAQFAFVQSDEVSVLVHGYKTFNSQAYFDNKLQKIVSVAAAVAAATFTANSWRMWAKTAIHETDRSPSLDDVVPGYFDARAFVLPESDVNNYFVWRQRDALRNSVQMFASHHFSHKELHKKSTSEMIDMCKAKGADWHALPTTQKQGRCVHKHHEVVDGVSRSHFRVDTDIPRFNDVTLYIERFLCTEDSNHED